eukprot:1919031-Karenia_brevis.AAC.1
MAGALLDVFRRVVLADCPILATVKTVLSIIQYAITPGAVLLLGCVFVLHSAHLRDFLELARTAKLILSCSVCSRLPFIRQ